MYIYIQRDNIRPNLIVADVSGLAVDSGARQLYYISEMDLYVTDVDGRTRSLPIAQDVLYIAIGECER